MNSERCGVTGLMGVLCRKWSWARFLAQNANACWINGSSLESCGLALVSTCCCLSFSPWGDPRLFEGTYCMPFLFFYHLHFEFF